MKEGLRADRLRDALPSAPPRFIKLNDSNALLRIERYGTGATTREVLWYEAELDRKWVVGYRLVSQDGRPAVAEVAVYPGPLKSRRPRGERKVPLGGVPARVLRKARIGRATEESAELFRVWRKWL